jgi:predicted dehydrogenase
MEQEQNTAATETRRDDEMTEAVETENDGASRRDFLRGAGVAAATALLTGGIAAGGAKPAAAAAGYKMAGGIPVPKADTAKMEGGKFPKGTVIASGRAIGANDRINVAFVGTGGMGGAHVHHFSDEAKERNIQVAAICDVYKPRRDGNAKYAQDKGAAAASLQVDKDYRKLLENKDIDAIVVATPEHWHAQVACHAMEAGKHVYIQKPMTRYLDEAFQVHDTAVRTKRVVQIGSQGCSDMRFHASAKAIKEGRIGKLVRAEDAYTRAVATAEREGRPAAGEWNYGIPGDLSPETFDWEMWLGSAPYRKFVTKGGAGGGQDPLRDDSGARFTRYRKYLDYSNGILGDLMPHRLHPILLATGAPEYPIRVTALGTQMLPDREVDDNVTVLAEFPSGWTMTFIGSTLNEAGLPRVIHGTKGNVLLSGPTPQINPERPYTEVVEGGPLTVEGPNFETHQNHEKDWLTSIRTGKTPNCNIDLATKVQTIISLAEMSMRLNKVMLFDEKTRTYRAA